MTPDAPFVALSRFTVANGMSEQVREAFLARPHLVDGAEGFRGIEVFVNSATPEEFWLLTRWTDRGCYERWHRGHAYHDSHAGIPKGLKLVKGSAAIALLQRFAT